MTTQWTASAIVAAARYALSYGLEQAAKEYKTTQSALKSALFRNGISIRQIRDDFALDARPSPPVTLAKSADKMQPAGWLALGLATPGASYSAARAIEAYAGGCRWPCGDPHEDTFCFCDSARLERGPYCAKHAKMSHLAPNELS
jgi:hypothetical protein